MYVNALQEFLDEQEFRQNGQNQVGKQDGINDIRPAVGADFPGGDFESVVVKQVRRQPENQQSSHIADHHRNMEHHKQDGSQNVHKPP